MILNRISFAIVVLVFGMATVSSAWAKKPAVDNEGMELVRDSELATVYADPGADLSIYNSVWLKDAEVSFRKNWQRDQRRTSSHMRVRTSDMEKIQDDVATLFREVFTKELTEGGYQLVEEAGGDVLLVKPAIVNLDVVAPDVGNSSSFSRSYSNRAGEMTLNIELFDSLT
ncbi:MAG: DUF3313 domain-containing protein, partial [Xanthomonadales bacterium]|nr:DUF3313 domain-containing protein [Xanthomonadales bacterium]